MGPECGVKRSKPIVVASTILGGRRIDDAIRRHGSNDVERHTATRQDDRMRYYSYCKPRYHEGPRCQCYNKFFHKKRLLRDYMIKGRVRANAMASRLASFQHPSD